MEAFTFRDVRRLRYLAIVAAAIVIIAAVTPLDQVTVAYLFGVGRLCWAIWTY